MPELPEVETIARDLQSRIVGAQIVEVRVRRADVLREIAKGTFRKRLIGDSIQRVWRRAKHAVIDLASGNRITVQPRFTGALLVEAPDSPLSDDEERYSTLTLQFSDQRSLHYYDVRRLGTVTLMSPERFDKLSNAIGVEPLAEEFTVDLFSGLLRGSAQAVKKFIMDQSKVAGIGNIYANEALFIAGIDPSKAARDVSETAARELHGSIIRILASAIEARGTSFRDYRDASGEPGEFFSKLSAYGREGLPCNHCGRKLIGTHAIDGRATVFCSHCQQ